jgi:hypothetical protein
VDFVDIVDLRKHRDGGGGCVDAPLRLGRGDALHSVHATLKAKLRVHVVARDRCDYFLEPAGRGFTQRHDLDLPALCFRVSRIHSEEIGCKQGCLLSSGAAANLEDGVALVVGILR